MTNPDELEVAPAALREELQGSVFQAASDEDLRNALEKAFSYRGDVTLTLKDGNAVEGYVFDRQTGRTLAESWVRLFPKNEARKLSVRYADIAAIAFTGKDTAAGKSWEAWVRKYWEKKNAGEKNIELKPEALD